MDMVQGSHRNSKTQFYDFPMTLHDQQCNFHDYLMYHLHPPLLAASSPCKAIIRHAETVMYLNKHACRLSMHLEII